MYERGIIEKSFYIFKNDEAYKIDVISVSEDEDLGHEYNYYAIATKDGVSMKKGATSFGEACVVADDAVDMVEQQIFINNDTSFTDFNNQINRK